ncbi:diguanylate cyclase [Shewanella waksmanii]|uniref:diguanylate cyclase n=1 Tax=Shewanella waksmanii TaxID=213783 RepID=UPI003735EE95
MNIKSQLIIQLILAIFMLVMIGINLLGLKEVQSYSYNKLQQVLAIEHSIASLTGKLWLLQKYQDNEAKIQAEQARHQLGQLLQSISLEHPQEQMLINNIKRLNTSLNNLLHLAQNAPTHTQDTSILTPTGMLTARLNTTMLSMGEELTQLQHLVIDNAESAQQKLLFIVAATLIIIALLVISINGFTLSRMRAGLAIFAVEFRKMAKGNLDSKVVVPHNNEFKTLGNYYNIMKSSLANITRRKEALTNEVAQQAKALQSQHQQLQHIAEHDELTGLYNRRAFESIVNKSICRCQRQHQGLALLFIDIDKFKLTNDHYGHDIGDLILQQLAECITQVTRKSDTCCRLGGDEFIICLEPINTAQDYQVVLGKLFEQINIASQKLAEKYTCMQTPPKSNKSLAEKVCHRPELQLQISVGVSCYPQNGDNLAALIKQADQAMYCAKQHAGNQYQAAQSDPHFVASNLVDSKNKHLSS